MRITEDAESRPKLAPGGFVIVAPLAPAWGHPPTFDQGLLYALHIADHAYSVPHI
jgi:hypothetical protein